jgi:pimeloyl-ACP methyl ester carboxylesterase
VAISPFTTLRQEGARLVGNLLSYLLTENYDNRARLAEIHRLNPSARVTIVHGTEDDVIPFAMGQALAHEFPFVELIPVPGGDHVTVLELARAKIIAAMNSAN